MRVHGVRHRVLVGGTGPPLLLLHGIGGSADEWLSVLPPLAERFRTIAPDAVGHGFSEKPPAHPYDVETYTQSVLGIMDAYGIDQTPLMAVSGGGAVALSLALRHPQRLSKLVLVDAAGLGRGVAWRYRLATLPFTRSLMRRTNRRAIEAFGRGLCFHRDRLPEGWVERRLDIWATAGAVEAFVATVRANLTLRGQRVEFSTRLEEILQPTLVIWGRQDTTLPVSHGIQAAQRIPGARLHVFEQCGHMPFWEYPREFAQLVLEFLSPEA